jgi:hypothetical protein
MNFTRACFCVATICCLASYALTGEWYWMLLGVGNATNAYVFGPEKDDEAETV